jgi:hypothetical protein
MRMRMRMIPTKPQKATPRPAGVVKEGSVGVRSK